MRATDPAIRKKVITQYLAGYGRNQIARENNIGEATTTDILNRWKRDVDAAAVYEKADMERIPLDTAAYKIVEDIRDYSQLGILKKEQDRLQQQIFLSNMKETKMTWRKNYKTYVGFRRYE